MKEITRLPDSELEIMLIIWDIGGVVNTSQIMEALKEEKTVQVVQTYLSRLENKGFVKKEKIGRLNHFKPLVSLKDYRAQETGEFMDKFYPDNATGLFVALLENQQVSPAELEKIKRLLEESEETS